MISLGQLGLNKLVKLNLKLEIRGAWPGAGWNRMVVVRAQFAFNPVYPILAIYPWILYTYPSPVDTCTLTDHVPAEESYRYQQPAC